MACSSSSLERMLETELEDLAAAQPLDGGRAAERRAAACHTGGDDDQRDQLLDDALVAALCRDDVYTRVCYDAAALARAHSEPLPARGGTTGGRASPPSMQSSWQAPAQTDGAICKADVSPSAPAAWCAAGRPSGGAPVADVAAHPAAAATAATAGAVAWPTFSGQNYDSMDGDAAAASRVLQLQLPALPTASLARHSVGDWQQQQHQQHQQQEQHQPPQLDGSNMVLMVLPWSVAMSVAAAAGNAGVALVSPPPPAMSGMLGVAGVQMASTAEQQQVQQHPDAVRMKRCASESVMQLQQAARSKLPRLASAPATQQVANQLLGSEHQVQLHVGAEHAGAGLLSSEHLVQPQLGAEHAGAGLLGSEHQVQPYASPELLRKRQHRLRVHAKLTLLQRQAGAPSRST